MTHEVKPQDEAGGPEHDHSLPDADQIPVFDDPAAADGAPLEGDL